MDSNKNPRIKPKIISLNLSLIHKEYVDLLNPYLASRPNCRFQSKKRFGICTVERKQIVTNEHLQIDSFKSVDQVP